MQPTRQEHLWVLRAQTGDREAMNQLFLLVQDPLYRFLRSLGVDAHRAEDLLQEVFVTIYAKVRWLRDPALFRAWTFRIAHRMAARSIEGERRERDLFDEGAQLEEVAGDTVLASVPEGELEALLARVTPKSRAVLALRFEHGLELVEIADVMELPLGTVKSRLSYGLSTLREMLADGARAARSTPS